MRRVTLAVCAVCLCTSCAPARATPLTDQLLAVSQEWGSEPFDQARVREQLRSIARDVARAARAEPRAGALRKTVFERWHFSREVDDHALRFALLPQVLQSRRGGCVGLGSLYLAIAEELAWPMSGVMVPGHFFVRMHDRDPAHNLELLRRGEAMPDAWYRERFAIAGGSAAEYGRALSSAEVVGIVEYDAGDDRRQRGQLSEARRAYARAGEHFPQFAEAHASRGAMAHLLGELEQALFDYQVAQRANPYLPGLVENMALLQRERSQLLPR